MSNTKRKSTYNQRKEARFSPYQNGVKDANGHCVIRPMTQEEIDYLERFNRTEVDSTFTEDSPHNILIEKYKKELAYLKRVKTRVKNRIKKLSNTGYVKAKNRKEIKQNKSMNDLKIKELYIKLREVEDKIRGIDIKAQIEHNNYARREDTMNYATRIRDGFEEDNILSEFDKKEQVLDLVDILKLNNTNLKELIDDTSDD